MDGFPRIYVINGAEYYLTSDVGLPCLKPPCLKPEDEEEKSKEDESD